MRSGGPGAGLPSCLLPPAFLPVPPPLQDPVSRACPHPSEARGGCLYDGGWMVLDCRLCPAQEAFGTRVPHYRVCSPTQGSWSPALSSPDPDTWGDPPASNEGVWT